VKWTTAWRRRPWAGHAVVLVALAAIGVGYAALAPRVDRAEAANPPASQQDVAQGKRLFNQTCASCHGLNLEGTRQAPSLIGVGAASVDFQVGTGRMPAMTPGAQMPRKPPVEPFNIESNDPEVAAQARENLADLAAYVQSIGGGPAVPPRGLAEKPGDTGVGGNLFRANCAQCHNYAGSGGALTGGKSAPSLDRATPTQIYEALITGPQAMPVFNDSTLRPQDKQALISYIIETREEVNPGGLGLGRIGPVSEGLVGWIIGLGLMIVAAMWITAKKPKKRPT
jgi:ubiquinol-cytochrome c reductase cytochrome c subunit